MKKIFFPLLVALMAFVGCQRKGITPVSFTDVHVEDTFWRQRLEPCVTRPSVTPLSVAPGTGSYTFLERIGDYLKQRLGIK
ncbi:MAG: hypothetical protein IJ434_03375 [Alistipes sp.]|nr:hypothetical protein [Alistipes sp.]